MIFFLKTWFLSNWNLATRFGDSTYIQWNDLVFFRHNRSFRVCFCCMFNVTFSKCMQLVVWGPGGLGFPCWGVPGYLKKGVNNNPFHLVVVSNIFYFHPYLGK